MLNATFLEDNASAVLAAFTSNFSDDAWTYVGAAAEKGSTEVVTDAEVVAEDTVWLTDETLRIIGRIAAVLLLVLTCGACIVAYYKVPALKKKLIFADDRRPKRIRAKTRGQRFLEVFEKVCCCFSWCPGLHKVAGFEVLQPRVEQLLRITLIHASQITGLKRFYFEVWTEPVEGYPKNSKIYEDSFGECDLGCERIELDWHGDEKAVLLHAVSAAGGKLNKDTPIGELRLDRQTLLRYSHEAATGDANDVSRGTRLFPLRALGKEAKFDRDLRFKTPNPAVPAITHLIQEKAGFESSEYEEVMRLREENKALRGENMALKTQLGGVSNGAFLQQVQSLPPPMHVAVRFEIVGATIGATGQALSRMSFHEHENEHDHGVSSQSTGTFSTSHG